MASGQDPIHTSVMLNCLVTLLATSTKTTPPAGGQQQGSYKKQFLSTKEHLQMYDIHSEADRPTSGSVQHHHIHH